MEDPGAVQELRAQLTLAASAGSLATAAQHGGEATPWCLSDVKHGRGGQQHGAKALTRHSLPKCVAPDRHSTFVDSMKGPPPPKQCNRPVQLEEAAKDMTQHPQITVSIAPATTGAGAASTTADSAAAAPAAARSEQPTIFET
eukprot:g2845.t1